MLSDNYEYLKIFILATLYSVKFFDEYFYDFEYYRIIHTLASHLIQKGELGVCLTHRAREVSRLGASVWQKSNRSHHYFWDFHTHLELELLRRHAVQDRDKQRLRDPSNSATFHRETPRSNLPALRMEAMITSLK